MWTSMLQGILVKTPRTTRWRRYENSTPSVHLLRVPKRFPQRKTVSAREASKEGKRSEGQVLSGR